jgi:hypothetical protein
MMSLSKIILIFYFLATKFSELLQYENIEERNAKLELVKNELQFEVSKQDGFQMIDANYKQKVWDNLFYSRTLTQNIITAAVAIELLVYFLTAVYLTVVLVKFLYIRIKKACKTRQ